MKETKYSLVPYQTDNGKIIEVTQAGEDIWLSQKQIAELFQKDISTITRHINNIFAENELQRDNRTIAKIAIVQKEGGRDVSREVPFYSLDMIISVGYRVNSKRGVKFRQWATQVIKNRIKQEYNNNKNTETITDNKRERAKLIKQKLIEKGITQKQIGEELGLSNVSICYAINGKHFSLTFEKWLKDNLFKEEKPAAKHPLVEKAERIFQTALKGDYKAYNDLLGLFKVIYGFKSAEKPYFAYLSNYNPNLNKYKLRFSEKEN